MTEQQETHVKLRIAIPANTPIWCGGIGIGFVIGLFTGWFFFHK